MSRLTDLIAQAKVKDAALGTELEREFKALANRRAFGLNFERHAPESVELPGRPIRKGDKVRVLPPRGSLDNGDPRLWKVKRTHKKGDQKVAELTLLDAQEPEVQSIPVEDLIVVAEMQDYIYPGLVSTGKVERGGDKPYHTVINGENFHALEALTFTHRGKIDVIYIDPPYNTGAKDWKYNNDYVEGDDLYRHSKWLAFMERRLKIAASLLNPICSVLIVTIDEKEYLRLGMLLEQMFPDGRIQMVSSVISSQASVRDGSFSRNNEYIYFVMFGDAFPERTNDDMLNEGLSSTKSQLWFQFVRTGNDNLRGDRKGMFYPLFLEPETGKILSVGDAIDVSVDKETVPVPEGALAIWPETASGQEGRWRTGPEAARSRVSKGLLRAGKSARKASGWSIMSVNAGTEKRIENGEIVVEKREANGDAVLREIKNNQLRTPKTVWNKVSHNAGWHGSKLVAQILPGRAFPYPKALYAVEDAIRLFCAGKSQATILDFFAGSGTTAHAIMRLNKQDGGKRHCISVTNNEVAADEHKELRENKLRAGDPDWEKWGICDYITKPRIKAVITGETPDGEPIEGDYKFIDEFPIADGFEENAEFFTLTYETPISISHNRAFSRIAPLLWIKAGSEGRRIDNLPNIGWDVADTYGLLTDLDLVEPYVRAIEANNKIRIAYIVTDDDRRFQAVAQSLPDRVEPVRLYESYLKNFRFAMRR